MNCIQCVKDSVKDTWLRERGPKRSKKHVTLMWQLWRCLKLRGVGAGKCYFYNTCAPAPAPNSSQSGIFGKTHTTSAKRYVLPKAENQTNWHPSVRVSRIRLPGSSCCLKLQLTGSSDRRVKEPTEPVPWYITWSDILHFLSVYLTCCRNSCVPDLRTLHLNPRSRDVHSEPP